MKLAPYDKPLICICGTEIGIHTKVIKKHDQLNFQSPGKDIQFLSYQYQVHGKVPKHLTS